MPEIDKREINRSPFIVIVAALCLIISGCLSGGTVSDLPDCKITFSGLIAGYWDNCQGTETYTNGDQYVGEFKDGKHHGQGTFTYADGFQEEGRWQDGNFLG